MRTNQEHRIPRYLQPIYSFRNATVYRPLTVWRDPVFRHVWSSAGGSHLRFLLLIEKMAIHLQDPFENKPTDTPMTSIAAGIEKNLKQMLAEETPEQELIPEQKYYMM